MSSDRKTIGSYLRTALDALRGRRGAARASRRQDAFALMYERFREILGLNNSALETFADLEDRLSGCKPLAMQAAAQLVRKTALDVFVMVKNLNLISGGKDRALYAALERVNAEIEAELPARREATAGPLILRLFDLRSGDAPAAGSKMATLGEVHATCGLAVPDGFVITTDAFALFMTDNDLWQQCERLEQILAARDHAALGAACREVESAILRATVPTGLAAAIRDAYRSCHVDAPPVAMRSSAVGEDDPRASHAGLYRSVLNVSEAGLLDAYRSVVASAFGPTAVAYRLEHGIGVQAAMAVGCMRMVSPHHSGIAFSRPPGDEVADAVVISVVTGLSDGLTAGREDAELLHLQVDRLDQAQSRRLDRFTLKRLVDAVRQLERHFGAPQDVEWALDRTGQLAILQTRPMTARTLRVSAELTVTPEVEPLCVGGLTACPGLGAGHVFQPSTDQDLDDFPEGAVLVTPHSSPKFSRVMSRCAAIVSNVGSPTGHMSILAREFGVPTIVGMDGATTLLSPGRLVTVDATTCRVFDRALVAETGRTARPQVLSPADVTPLERVARFVTPLNLIDPADPSFSPEGCRSLHDITRYVHERVFETMFHYGDLVAGEHQDALRLRARLPIDVLVFDVGGGLVPGSADAGSVGPQDIASVPMTAFLEGLLDERIKWDQPRPVSMRGFLSVLGENIAAPPADALQLGRASYAIISDSYLNFSTKAGYHFSTLDTYCEPSQNKTYIHFRFAGGAADETRRMRRVRFVSTVLSALNFRVNARRDMLGARLDKIEPRVARARLADLGRLTLCVRQMDMLMDSDAVPDLYARAFLAGEWHRF